LSLLVPSSTGCYILFFLIKGEWITGVSFIIAISKTCEGVIGIACSRFFCRRGGFFGLLFVEGQTGGKLTASSGGRNVERCWRWWD
jgi:hypothetical protein